METIIMGLLHCDLNDNKMRTNVAEVNKILRRKCHKMHFTFAEQDADWIKEDSLNMESCHKDRIQLNRQGNVKFANTVIRKLKALTSSSFSSDIIMRIPSSEVETRTNIFHSCPSPPPLPLNISSPIGSGPSVPCHSRVSSHVIDVPPVCDYDHAKALELMSSRPLLCYVSFRQTCKRPQRKFRVALSSTSPMSSSAPVSPSSSVSSPLSPCSSSSPNVSPHTSSQYHWSFHISCLSFLMMVLSNLTLSSSLMSPHFHQLLSLSRSHVVLNVPLSL